MERTEKVSRRKVLVWTAPLVSVSVLPAHAQTTPVSCSVALAGEDAPILSVTTPPKCAGNPPVGSATIDIRAPAGCELTLQAITITSSDPKNVISGLPSFPAVITSTDTISITWTGPASDGLTCLPLTTMTLTIEYTVDGVTNEVEVYDLTEILVNSVP